MLINGKSITDHNARQWRVDIGNRKVKNDSEWVRGSPLPLAGIISAINQTSENITIDASKINLTASDVVSIISSGDVKNC